MRDTAILSVGFPLTKFYGFQNISLMTMITLLLSHPVMQFYQHQTMSAPFLFYREYPAVFQLQLNGFFSPTHGLYRQAYRQRVHASLGS